MLMQHEYHKLLTKNREEKEFIRACESFASQPYNSFASFRLFSEYTLAFSIKSTLFVAEIGTGFAEDKSRFDHPVPIFNKEPCLMSYYSLPKRATMPRAPVAAPSRCI